MITGANSGIGKQAALALASRGWHIIGVGRDAQRTATVEAEIRAASNVGEVAMLRADLSRLVDAARLAEEIARLTPRLDLLANNAGGMAAALVMTRKAWKPISRATILGRSGRPTPWSRMRLSSSVSGKRARNWSRVSRVEELAGSPGPHRAHPRIGIVSASRGVFAQRVGAGMSPSPDHSISASRRYLSVLRGPGGQLKLSVSSAVMA